MVFYLWSHSSISLPAPCPVAIFREQDFILIQTLFVYVLSGSIFYSHIMSSQAAKDHSNVTNGIHCPKVLDNPIQYNPLALIAWLGSHLLRITSPTTPAR
jgi:hypothetical protein